MKAGQNMLTTKEVAELAGIQVESVRKHRQRGTIPEPDTYVGATPVWYGKTVAVWLQNRRHRGRPAHSEKSDG